MWGVSKVIGIGSPFAFGYFNGNQTGQTLLLARSIQCWEFAAYSDTGVWDWVFEVASSLAVSQARFHRMQIIIMSTTCASMLALWIWEFI